VAELRKDPNKDAEFLYSKFSPFVTCIRTEEKFKLRDILSLVQTVLLKLYIESDLVEKIHEFFNTLSA